MKYQEYMMTYLQAHKWSMTDCTRLGALRQISIFQHMSGADFLSISDYLNHFVTLSWWCSDNPQRSTLVPSVRD